MGNEMRHAPDPAGFAHMSTAEMRATFLIENLFVPGQVKWVYAHTDRAVIGAAIPVNESLLLSAGKELAAGYFTQRRELGVINIGGPGAVVVGGREFILAKREAAYIGRGDHEIRFCSAEPASPAQFYFVSYPAHSSLDSVPIRGSQKQSTAMGSFASCNQRTIHKLIYPGGVPSCQLTMGLTELAEGSVWNTMPAHTHGRRSEIYLYFDLPEDGLVVHCMGEPHETRHVLVRDRQVVISPDWSVHFGVGTSNYSFIWAMGGENQEFSDMDLIPMTTLF
jgi:4-deoxy-L-threo-5-hexosulose-uronate ketol-isomerase